MEECFMGTRNVSEKGFGELLKGSMLPRLIWVAGGGY